MCPVNTVRNVEFINYQAISKCLCEQRTSSFQRNVEGLKCLLTNNLKRRTFLMNWLDRDSVIEERRLFQNFTTVVQKFQVLDLHFFLQKSFNECEETLSELTDKLCMNQTQRKRIYYPNLNLFVSCTSWCCKICHFRRSYNL